MISAQIGLLVFPPVGLFFLVTGRYDVAFVVFAAAGLDLVLVLWGRHRGLPSLFDSRRRG